MKNKLMRKMKRTFKKNKAKGMLLFEMADTPGQLQEISKILSEVNANVVQLEHNQFKAANRLKNVLLEVTVETNGTEHIDLIKSTFNKKGFKIIQMY